MKKEDIEKAATEYANEACRPLWRTGNEQVCMVDFMEGAKWRINSVWHTMDEAQDGKRPYIVQYNEEWKFAMFTKPISIPKEQAKSVFKRWAYMDDLIPDTED
jgi:hypothetical protein